MLMLSVKVLDYLQEKHTYDFANLKFFQKRVLRVLDSKHDTFLGRRHAACPSNEKLITLIVTLQITRVTFEKDYNPVVAMFHLFKMPLI